MTAVPEPIADGEHLYRRMNVTQNFYDHTLHAPPSYKAFRPHRDRDKTGLSVYRAKLTTLEELVGNTRGARFYIAVLRAGDLRENGIEIVPRPSPENGPGHAELPELRSDNRDDGRALAMQMLLAERLCLRVEGPLPNAVQRIT